MGSNSPLPSTVPDLVAWAGEVYGSRDAVIGAGQPLTFAELAARATQAARALIDLGVAKGDRVVLWCPNVGEWIEAALGIHIAGGVLVPLNTRYKGPEAVDVISRSGAKVVLAANQFLDRDYLAEINEVLVADGKEHLVDTMITVYGPTSQGSLAWSEVMAQGSSSQAELPDVGPDDLSDIMFTSGTTGRSKGVMTTQGRTVKVFDTWATLVGLDADDRYLIVNPFFHTFGYKAGIIACLIKGTTMIPEAVFDPARVAVAVEKHRITMLPGPPTLYLSLLNEPALSAHDLSSLRLAVTGAAAVPVSMINRMRTELNFETILTAYGLTESTGVVSMCRQGDSAEVISTTSGRAIPGVEIKIVDDSGVGVPNGEQGEIVVRGYNVMVGYYNQPEATAETIDADGWLHTGDIGVMDEEGNIAITDRLKDMFIVGGFNAYPAEIENTMSAHPAIAQVAVIGISDNRMGEVGCAFVVAKSGSNPNPEEIVAWCRTQMANYKVPRIVHVVESLPTNASGKVLKNELRALSTSSR